MTVAAVPTCAENVEAIDPPAKEGANVAGAGPEYTAREPEPLAAAAGVGGNWVSTDAGTMNEPAPAVVVQMNSVAVVTAEVPVPVDVPQNIR